MRFKGLPHVGSHYAPVEYGENALTFLGIDESPLANDLFFSQFLPYVTSDRDPFSLPQICRDEILSFADLAILWQTDLQFLQISPLFDAGKCDGKVDVKDPAQSTSVSYRSDS